MTHVQKRRLCWLIAAAMTAGLMTFVLCGTNVIYAANDDAAIMRGLMGHDVTYHLFIHGLLVWTLSWLGKLFPSLPWFSYAQMAFLALSCLIIAKGVMQSFLKYEKPLWLGAAAAAVVLLTLCMKHITHLTFTLTSALLNAAAVVQIMSIEHDRGSGRVIAGMMGALVLAGLSYAIRLDALLPVLGLCGLAFVLQVWEYYGVGKKAGRSLRPMVISLTVIAVVMGGMAGLRLWENSRPEVQEYRTWHDSRTVIMDYVGINNVPRRAWESVGWDEPTYMLAREEWYFLDSDLSTEAFQTLVEYAENVDSRTLPGRVKEACKLILRTVQTNELDMLCLSASLAAVLICFAGACAKRDLRLLASLAGFAALAGAMIFYLAYDGRLPMRALLVAAIPCAAAGFCLLPACLPSGKWARAACCVLVAGVCVCSLAGIVPALTDRTVNLDAFNPVADLEEYALGEPDSLFVYDLSITSMDLEVFPDRSGGMPGNVAFWGGWELRSPESVRQFAKYGIDLANCSPADLMQDHVFIASVFADPPRVLLEWLQANVDPSVEYQLVAKHGLAYIYRFVKGGAV